MARGKLPSTLLRDSERSRTVTTLNVLKGRAKLGVHQLVVAERPDGRPQTGTRPGGRLGEDPDLAGLVQFLLFPFNQFYPLTEVFLALKKELHLIVQ